MKNIGTSTIPIRAYSLAELSLLYGMSTKTLNRWLQPHKAKIGPRMGRYYTSWQIKQIFEILGPPEIPSEELFQKPSTG